MRGEDRRWRGERGEPKSGRGEGRGGGERGEGEVEGEEEGERRGSGEQAERGTNAQRILHLRRSQVDHQ